MENFKDENQYVHKIEGLIEQVKNLQYDCAELVKVNEELRDRVEKLATRLPQWPKGYRPRKYNTEKKI